MQDVNHTSNSAFKPWDNYTQEVIHPEWWPEGYAHHIKGHACYDPTKVCQPPPIFLAQCPTTPVCSQVFLQYAAMLCELGHGKSICQSAIDD